MSWESTIPIYLCYLLTLFYLEVKLDRSLTFHHYFRGVAHGTIFVCHAVEATCRFRFRFRFQIIYCRLGNKKDKTPPSDTARKVNENNSKEVRNYK